MPPPRPSRCLPMCKLDGSDQNWTRVSAVPCLVPLWCGTSWPSCVRRRVPMDSRKGGVLPSGAKFPPAFLARSAYGSEILTFSARPAAPAHKAMSSASPFTSGAARARSRCLQYRRFELPRYDALSCVIDSNGATHVPMQGEVLSLARAYCFYSWSKCGRWLACGDDLCRIAVFDDIEERIRLLHSKHGNSQ